MKTIKEFCTIHNACVEGRDWAMANCETMSDVWVKAKPEWLVWVATRRGVSSRATLSRFAFWCADRSARVYAPQKLRRNGKSIEAEKLESLAPITDKDSAIAARKICHDASAYHASMAASSASCLSLPESSALAAAHAAYSARAQCDANYESERFTQAEWLRANAVPNFE